jgi:hypothetical protein
VITSDHELDEFNRGDVALRGPPGNWSAANDALEAPEP